MNSLSEKNWLIAGLGNPGERYETTRHNLGFRLIDELARSAQTQVKRDECRSLIGRAIIAGEVVELVKPQTYMNLSGEAVACLLKKENRDVRKLIVIVDDLALPVGAIRLRPKGSDGGHNGLKSIAACLKTKDYMRLRIGIRPEHPINDTKRFVLESFSKTDVDLVDEALRRGAAAIESVLSDGIEKAMANFNADSGTGTTD